MTDIEIITRLDGIEKKAIELVAENAELLAALKKMLTYSTLSPIKYHGQQESERIAKAAIEKAEKI